MTAFRPTGPAVLWLVAAVLAATLLLGYGIARLRSLAQARFAAWGLVVLAAVTVERLAAGEPPGLRMLVLVAALLYAMKAPVSVEWRARNGVGLSPVRWLAFACAWPGMRPDLFASLGRARLAGWGRLVLRGAARLAAGAALVALARSLWVRTGSHALATIALLPGLSLGLHFGLFDVAAGLWRLAGADCRALFRAPLASRSLREFWGRRWNLGFSEMMAAGVYRPLSDTVGKPAAIMAVFLCSGLLHELAISVPVRAGFGRPLLYFAIHGGLMLAERGLEAAGRPVDHRAWIGRAWTLASLAVPLPLLFHRPFLERVVWPLIGAGPLTC